MKERFVHLHCHSDMSQLDGCATIESYVRKAAERGNPALALTDHGTLRGIYDLTELCEKHDVKPIYGIEFWVCKDMNRRGLTDEEKEDATKGIESKTAQKEAVKELERKLGIRRTHHLTAWALDDEGLKNLYRLSSESWTRGFYYRPRIDLETLCKYNKGIAIGTGCAGSVIYGNKWENNKRDLDIAVSQLIDTFDDRLYLEIMPHDLDEGRQADANEFAYHLHELTGGKLRFIATQDAHYLERKHARHHEVMLSVNTGGAIGDERFTFDGEQYWFKTRREMQDAFTSAHGYLGDAFVANALDGTHELAERCTARIDIDPLRCLLPAVALPEEFKRDEFGYLKHLVMQGIETRDLAARAATLAAREGISESAALRQYTSRLARELKTLRDANFSGYFLILHDLYRWVKEQDIGCGPGRGSAAGSLVSYLLGITQVDPIEHRLMFERFIAPGRLNMPDIDCDFSDTRRSEIFAYLRQKYGEDHVAHISTFGRMQAKQAVKDVARVYQVSFQVANVATAAIDSEDEENAIERAVERSEVFRKFAKENPDVIKHARALTGLTKSVGMHAAGIVTSPVPLQDVVPLEVRKPAGGAVTVTAFDLHGVEGLGLLKIDVLGLKTVTVLDRAEKAIAARLGQPFSLLEVSLEDGKTLDAFTARDFVGVFQFDSPSANAICEGLEFKQFDDIAVVNSINRPGAKDFADEYKKRRKNPKLAGRHVFHEKVTEITRDALGLMIYQEHVVKVATSVAGMTPSEADLLRRKIGKSEGYEALEEERGTFVSGCIHTTEDMNEDTANRLFDAIVKFGRYGFNRSHAVCYSMLSYWTMYLKQHHPLEFYWSLMVSENDEKKIQRFARDAKNHDVQTMLPDVNISGHSFEIDYAENAVRGSLLDIHGLGDAAVSAIVEARKSGPFTSFTDFLQRREGRAVTKKTVSALVSAGAFDALVPNPRWLTRELQRLWKHVESKRWADIEKLLEESRKKSQWTYDERMKEAASVNPLAMRPHAAITWEEFLTHTVRPELEEINDAMFSKKRDVYCAGMITEVEQRYVGDSKSYSELPPPETRRRIGWDQPWVRFSVEGLEGKSWVKLDWRQYKLFNPLIEKGVGTPVVMCAETRPDYANLHVHYIADIEEMSAKLRDGKPLVIWEKLFVEHPSLTYPWKTKAEKALALADPVAISQRESDSFDVIGVVAHLYENEDRNGNLMSWFGIAGIYSYLRVICFSSSWQDMRDAVKAGRLVRLTLSKLDDGTVTLRSCARAVTVYKKEEVQVAETQQKKDEEQESEQQSFSDEDIPF